VDVDGSGSAHEVVEAENERNRGCDGCKAVGWTHEIQEKYRGGGEEKDDGWEAELVLQEGGDGKECEKQADGAGDDPAGAVELKIDEEEADGEDDDRGVRGEMAEGVEEDHGWGVC
jgi:hypothetical protein